MKRLHLLMLLLCLSASTFSYAGTKIPSKQEVPQSTGQLEKNDPKAIKKAERIEKFLNSKMGHWLINKIEKRNQRLQEKGRTLNPEKKTRTMADLKKLGLIIGLVGLAVIIVGAIALSGALVGIGGLAFLVGLILFIIGIAG